jgi:hypothetical protein
MIIFTDLPLDISKEIDAWVKGQLAYEDSRKWTHVVFTVLLDYARPLLVENALRRNTELHSYAAGVRFRTEHIKIYNYGSQVDRELLLVAQVQKYMLIQTKTLEKEVEEFLLELYETDDDLIDEFQRESMIVRVQPVPFSIYWHMFRLVDEVKRTRRLSDVYKNHLKKHLLPGPQTKKQKK